MNFKLKLTDAQASALLDYYKEEDIDYDKPPMRAFIPKKDVTISLFKTNIVLFQGRHAEKEKLFWQDTFGILDDDAIVPPKQKTDYYKTSIGSDESGVGDYFGPLTVCAVYVKKTDKAFLETLNIKDSKLLSDKQIKLIAPKLIKKFPYSLLVLSNTKYNTMIEKGYNAHKLKAHLHAQCHAHVMKKIDEKPPIIIDQFCTETHYLNYIQDFKTAPVPSIFLTKAETYFASVAVASIIARYSFLTNLAKLEETIDMPLPKGASKLVDDAARKILKEKGLTALSKVAKLHFKTTEKIQSK